VISDVESKVMELARAQMGLITAAQLDALGFSRHLVGRYLASKAWSRLTRGLYKVGAAAMTIEQTQLAALLAAGEGAALSHLSAAVKLRLDAPPVALIQLTVPAGRNHVPIAGVEVFRSRDLRADDVVLRGPFRVTSVGRTIVDLAASLSDDDLKAAIEIVARAVGLVAIELEVHQRVGHPPRFTSQTPRGVPARGERYELRPARLALTSPAPRCPPA
jgi:hypothetical protein